MENCITSKPLFERIIIDRENNKLSGFTFENLEDSKYQETYTYQLDPTNSQQTLYNAYLYKEPGLKKWIRHKAHNWGVETLEKIMKQDKMIKKVAIQKQLDFVNHKLYKINQK